MPASLNYRQLDDAEIEQTLARLSGRIAERFPGSGLSGISAELLAVSRDVGKLVAYVRRPHWPIRIGVGLAIAAMVAVVLAVLTAVDLPVRISGLGEFIQATEAAINDLVFLGVAVFFLMTVETRLKRRRALAGLHQLRSIAHIVDLHQLTKDPERLGPRPADAGLSTAERPLGPTELGRYLDYCSELLSLTSKIAALVVQHFNDPVILAAVNEIEALTTGLSGKIWQKITLLDRIAAPGPATAAPVLASADPVPTLDHG